MRPMTKIQLDKLPKDLKTARKAMENLISSQEFSMGIIWRLIEDLHKENTELRKRVQQLEGKS
jgi:hypothetical protein